MAKFATTATSVIALVIGAGLSLSACTGNPTSPSTTTETTGVTFAFDAVIETSCVVESLQVCTDAAFGTGVATGTPVSGKVTFNPNAAPVVLYNGATAAATKYFGVSVEFTVGSNTVRGNDSQASSVTVMSIPGQTDSFEVTVLHGFSTGRVGGLQIDYFSLFLPIVPSRFPDTTLPTDPAVFEPALSMPGVTAGVGIKHHTDPSFWPFGVSAPGPLLTASVAAVRRGA